MNVFPNFLHWGSLSNSLPSIGTCFSVLVLDSGYNFLLLAYMAWIISVTAGVWSTKILRLCCRYRIRNSQMPSVRNCYLRLVQRIISHKRCFTIKIPVFYVPATMTSSPIYLAQLQPKIVSAIILSPLLIASLKRLGTRVADTWKLAWAKQATNIWLLYQSQGQLRRSAVIPTWWVVWKTRQRSYST